MNLDYKDYYKILGVDKNAPEKDIKKAYRKLAREHHPDVNPGNARAEQHFKEINEAYEVLGDKEKRAQYDQMGPYIQGGQMPEDMFRRYGGGQGNSRSYHFDMGDMGSFAGASSGGMDGFSDFFNTFFSGGGKSSRGKARSSGRGQNFEHLFAEDNDFAQASSGKRARPSQEVPVELTLEEAAFGTSRILQVDKEIACERCQGNGSLNNTTCPECHGSGRKLRPTRLEVKIPAGVKEGQKIRVEEYHLVVKLKPHPFFELKNGELYCEVPVAITEAVLGAEIEIPTLKGNVTTRIPPETQSGKTLRLTGLGMPMLNKQPGNLYAKIRVVIPSKTGPKEKKLFEELAKAIQENPRADILARKWS
jgi:DnaJ-class molecular chaperone